jgi:hypothetical protein
MTDLDKEVNKLALDVARKANLDVTSFHDKLDALKQLTALLGMQSKGKKRPEKLEDDFRSVLSGGINGEQALPTRRRRSADA